MLIHKLRDKGLIHPPKWLPDNVHYMCVMGSTAYGVHGDKSDEDVYGFCIPPREDVFPHLRGEIIGFGRQVKRFGSWSEHHIDDKETAKEYDFAIYSIVNFFQLCMENNPNMVDALFVPQHCIKHATKVAELVLGRRKMFLHKGSFHKFRGYAFKQMSKIEGKQNSSNPKRAATIAEFGYDTKFAYHVVRLALEAEQILEKADLDLQCNSQLLNSIRRGEWTLDQLKLWWEQKERALNTLYETSKLPTEPDEAAIKQLLVDALEMHYGNLSAVVTIVGKEAAALKDIRDILDRTGI